VPIPSTTPAAVNFPGPYIASPCRLGTGDGEVGREIAFSIPWNTQGGANNCVNIDLRQNNVNPIRELRTLYVDNLSNSHATVFTMMDTNYRFVVPALTCGYYPVITNGLQFTVFNTGEITGDTTNVIALNIELSNPPQTSENIPGVAYNTLFGIYNSAGSLIFPQQKGQVNVWNVATQVGLPKVLATITDGQYVLTGLDVLCTGAQNTLATDGIGRWSLSFLNVGSGSGFAFWNGELVVPRNTFNSGLLYDVNLFSMSNLQIPLFANTDVGLPFEIFLEDSGSSLGITYRLLFNLYMARVA